MCVCVLRRGGPQPRGDALHFLGQFGLGAVQFIAVSLEMTAMGFVYRHFSIFECIIPTLSTSTKWELTKWE